MEEKEIDKVTVFDTIFTTNHIQMYKVLLSYLPISYQSTLAVYIKLAELKFTLSFFKRHPHARLYAPAPARAAQQIHDNADFTQLIDDISPYLSHEERNRFLQLKNMMQNMKNLQEIMEMAEMMKSLFPEGMGSSGEDGGNPFNSDFLSIISGMSGMDFDPSLFAQAMQMMNPGETGTETQNEPQNDKAE